jgi:hypothetical protein
VYAISRLIETAVADAEATGARVLTLVARSPERLWQMRKTGSKI